MTEKKTLRVQFEEVLTFLNENNATEEMIDFIKDRAEKSIRKNTSRKETPTQKHNKEVAEIAYKYLADTGVKILAKDLMKAVPEIISYDGSTTTQYTTAVLRLLVKDGRVDKKQEKGKTFYFAV